MKGFSILGLVVAIFASAPACDEDEAFFHACPLSQTLIDACAEQQENADITCAVREHPMCDEAVCAKFKGSASFCSRVCTTNEDCPPESTCEDYLILPGEEFRFCVPLEPPVDTVTQ